MVITAVKLIRVHKIVSYFEIKIVEHIFLLCGFKNDVNILVNPLITIIKLNIFDNPTLLTRGLVNHI